MNRMCAILLAVAACGHGRDNNGNGPDGGTGGSGDGGTGGSGDGGTGSGTGGTFTPCHASPGAMLPPWPTTGGGTAGVAVGDFVGDGKLDLAATNLQKSSVSVMIATGGG